MIDLGAGNPRRLCQLGRHASRLATKAGMDSIELEAVEQAAAELWGGGDSPTIAGGEPEFNDSFGQDATLRPTTGPTETRLDSEDSEVPVEEEVPRLPLRRSA